MSPVFTAQPSWRESMPKPPQPAGAALFTKIGGRKEGPAREYVAECFTASFCCAVLPTHTACRAQTRRNLKAGLPCPRRCLWYSTIAGAAPPRTPYGGTLYRRRRQRPCGRTMRVEAGEGRMP